MNYQHIKKCGTLHLEYSGPELDALALGVLEVQLHKIAEKVAMHTLLSDRRSVFALLDRPRFLLPQHLRAIKRRWPHYIDPFFPDFFPFHVDSTEESLRELPILRLRTDDIKHGSILQDLSLYLAQVLSTTDTRAVLQSFGGNLLYAIYQSGLRGIEYVTSPSNAPSEPTDSAQSLGPQQLDNPPTYDPYDVGDNLREIATELIANSNGEPSTITIKHKIGNGQSEVQIRIR